MKYALNSKYKLCFLKIFVATGPIYFLFFLNQARVFALPIFASETRVFKRSVCVGSATDTILGVAPSFDLTFGFFWACSFITSFFLFSPEANLSEELENISTPLLASGEQEDVCRGFISGELTVKKDAGRLE